MALDLTDIAKSMDPNDTRIQLVADPRLTRYKMAGSGFTALVSGPTGSGKTLSLRPLVEYLGADEILVIATDPRLAPLEGLDVPTLEAWIEPGAEGLALKNAAQAAFEKIQAMFSDIARAVKNEKVKTPKVLVFDSLSNYGDILQARLAPVGGQLSMPQWGQVARDALALVQYLRGLQVRGMLRIVNCTSGWTTDDVGRKVPELFIGTGGKMGPKHVGRYVDFQFHVEATYMPGDAMAGPDGMVRRFHTCEHDGISAKGHPALPTPYMKADWAEVYRLVMEGKA